MGKRFKGKTCAYCAVAGIANTGDHVLARAFLPVKHRGQIPQVPACTTCNKEKSDLEHYAATILLFGGRHPDSLGNLTNDAPRRLAKNQKLHRELAASATRVWSKQPSGILVRTTALPVDGERLVKLVGLIVRGLMFHHWDIVLGPDINVDVLSLTQYGERFFEQMRTWNAKQRVAGNIGDGALVYTGAQGVDTATISIWELSLLGGAVLAGSPKEGSTSRFGVMTGPKAISERANDRIRRGAFIIRP